MSRETITENLSLAARDAINTLKILISWYMWPLTGVRWMWFYLVIRSYLPALLQAKELGNLLNLHRAVVHLGLPHHVRQSTSHPQTAFFDRDAYHKFNTS